MLPSWLGGRSSRGPADDDHLRRRVGLYALVMFGVDVLAWVNDLVAPALVDDLPRVEYAPASLALRVASTVIVLTALFGTRFLRPPRSVLIGFEVFVTLGLVLVYAHVAGEQVTGAVADFAPAFAMFGVILVLGVRAALVPAPAVRTAFVGALSMVVLFVVLRARIEAADPRIQEGLQFIAIAYVVATVVTSHVIYGLRREVRAAMQLGQYTLEERLGQGGMGSVHRARHALLRRQAAIKLIRAEAGPDAPDVRARFEREADATASLESPHTVKLYDFGVSTEGEFYTVMELLRGIDLESAVRRFGPMPPERVAFLVRQACASLGEAHAAGLVHRDVKPANLMLCRYGGSVDFLKVLDFGLVSLAHVEDGGVHVAGTPAYLAPEVATGAPTVDGRADLYALGCVMHFALTGRLVFPRERAEDLVRAHVDEIPAAPSSCVESAIPPELDRLVLACLAKDPADRPRSAGELAQRLVEAVDVDAWSPARAAAWWDRHRPEEEVVVEADGVVDHLVTVRLR